MIRLALAAVLLSPAVGQAQILPQPGPGDPRIQTVVYDPDQVVQLQVAAGYQLTLEFAPGEQIENVAVGDSGSWQVTPNKRGDRLFLKAAVGAQSSNLVVVTDARTYVFDLTPMPGQFGGTPYTVRFRYPAPPEPAVSAVEPAAPGARYRIGGARALRPSEITDDGVRTYVRWPAGRSLPAVFTIDEQGREALVNGSVQEDRYVIDGVMARLVFRLDRDAASATRVPAKRIR